MRFGLPSAGPGSRETVPLCSRIPIDSLARDVLGLRRGIQRPLPSTARRLSSTDGSRVSAAWNAAILLRTCLAKADLKASAASSTVQSVPVRTGAGTTIWWVLPPSSHQLSGGARPAPLWLKGWHRRRAGQRGYARPAPTSTVSLGRTRSSSRRPTPSTRPSGRLTATRAGARAPRRCQATAPPPGWHGSHTHRWSPPWLEGQSVSRRAVIDRRAVSPVCAPFIGGAFNDNAAACARPSPSWRPHDRGDTPAPPASAPIERGVCATGTYGSSTGVGAAWNRRSQPGGVASVEQRFRPRVCVATICGASEAAPSIRPRSSRSRCPTADDHSHRRTRWGGPEVLQERLEEKESLAQGLSSNLGVPRRSDLGPGPDDEWFAASCSSTSSHVSIPVYSRL
jgi:hypothetical protein